MLSFNQVADWLRDTVLGPAETKIMILSKVEGAIEPEEIVTPLYGRVKIQLAMRQRKRPRALQPERLEVGYMLLEKDPRLTFLPLGGFLEGNTPEEAVGFIMSVGSVGCGPIRPH